MAKAVRSAAARIAVVAALVFGSTSCGKVVRQGEGTSYLILTELVAASGAEPTEFGATLFSDVETIVDDVPTVFADNGRVTLSLGLKDPGSPTAPASPSPNEFITIDRYHVRYIRADGRNKQGEDVPYEFDGAITFTVRGDTTQSFELVRHIAKAEPPLIALKRSIVIIGTIAEVTFYGHDQVGRAASVTGHISIQFGNFGDPD